MKRGINRWLAGVQPRQGCGVLAGPERRFSHGIPLSCPLRQVGLWAACQRLLGWVTDICGATGKVSHLRITHKKRRCGKKERGQRERGCPFVPFRSMGRWGEMQRWEIAITSLLQRYGFVNSSYTTDARDCCLLQNFWTVRPTFRCNEHSGIINHKSNYWYTTQKYLLKVFLRS